MSEEISRNIAKLMAKKYDSYMQGTAPPLVRISSGIAGLDKLLGGGLPCGRIIEIFSDPSNGKTTMAQHFLKELMKEGYDVGLVDCERTVDEQRLKQLGLEGDNFHYARPSTGPQALDLVMDLFEAGVKLVVLDSVPYLVTEAAQEADANQHTMSPVAVMLSRVQPKLVPIVEQNGGILIFINQMRSQIGKYGNPNQSSGGSAIKFMSSVRLRLTRAETATDGSGFTIKIKTEKCKVGLEKQTTLVDLKYDTGIDPVSSLRESMSELGLIYNKGSWFYLEKGLQEELGFESDKVGQGKSAVNTLICRPEIYDKLYQYVLSYKSGAT